ncbi:MAG: hypothetical protein H6710_21220 [Myxococcales bacterium]|nr:hypothetical protein [Myxococcales bacterium]
MPRQCNDLVACDDEAMGSLSACLIDRCDESVESFTEFTLSAALPNDGLSVCENICVNNANLERANCAANGGTTAVCTGVRDTFYGECVYNNCCGFWDRWTGKCDSVQWPY